ncbi:DUF6992 family protein [Roseivirga misakiensis]|uniref:DUF4149 domain-containing protein n=1 Tax=Roseivirga misakiensis TaxID=1563681 RepID=A0A1E5SKM4_9BACT|nr:hypothetical protein [Roseivirga misakiensis]OEJ99677.1 hypothetical protein BFP71_08900 [Roseivirga misakiensis]
MKKYLLVISIFTLFTFDAVAQTSELTEFNQERLHVNKIGMMVLGGWALGNMATNGVLLRNPSSNEQAHFYRMNIFWNVVNLALAVPGFRHSIITDPSSLSLAETTAEFHQMSKIVLMNAALDVAYITGGYLMREMAKTRPNKQDILRGYGKSLILQGGFLLAFDAVLFLALQSKSKGLTSLLDKVTITPESVGLVFRF